MNLPAEPLQIEDVVVIGAGLSGMTAAYELGRRGIRARIIAREEQVGSTWRKRHPQLSLNTHRDISHMPGLQYPSGTSAFPKRDVVAEHLAQFARDNALDIEHGVSVEALSRRDGVFHLATSAGPVLCRNVVVATGRDGDPWQPLFKGAENFGGQSIHACDFGDAKQYRGKRVLIVGAGNSGFDIANHLAKVDLADCWFSVRTGSSVLPKRLLGVAVHKFSPWLARLPTPVVDIAISLTERLAFGDLTKLGFPRSSHKAATRLARDHVAIPVDDGAIKAVREGRIKVVGEVVEFTQAGTVLHKNGVVTAPDVIIYATGYGAHHQSLLGKLVIENGHVPSPSGPDIPGLWFIGMTPGLISYFHNAREEAVEMAAAMRSRLDTDARSGR